MALLYSLLSGELDSCAAISDESLTRSKQPLIPLSTHKYKEVACPICHFMQDISMRPDVQSQGPGGTGGGGGGQHHGGPPPQGGGQQYK